MGCTDANAQFSQGVKCASGTGPAQDYVQAAVWYRQAAEQNHGLAQYNLGTMYALGQGVAKDAAQSRFWFGWAAHLGDAGGQYNMGRSCQRASLAALPAAAPGCQNAEGAYATLTFKMTCADVAAASRRVAQFSPARQPRPV